MIREVFLISNDVPWKVCIKYESSHKKAQEIPASALQLGSTLWEVYTDIKAKIQFSEQSPHVSLFFLPIGGRFARIIDDLPGGMSVISGRKDIGLWAISDKGEKGRVIRELKKGRCAEGKEAEKAQTIGRNGEKDGKMFAEIGENSYLCRRFM